MKRTKGFKEKVCSKCRHTDKKVSPIGRTCKIKNARMVDGMCNAYRK